MDEQTLSLFCVFAIPWISQHKAETPGRNIRGQWSRPRYPVWKAPPELNVQQLQTLRRDATDDDEDDVFRYQAIRLVTKLGFTDAVRLLQQVLLTESEHKEPYASAFKQLLDDGSVARFCDALAPLYVPSINNKRGPTSPRKHVKTKQARIEPADDDDDDTEPPRRSTRTRRKPREYDDPITSTYAD